MDAKIKIIVTVESDSKDFARALKLAEKLSDAEAREAMKELLKVRQ